MAYAEGKETHKETFHIISDLGNVNEGLSDMSFSINWQNFENTELVAFDAQCL